MKRFIKTSTTSVPAIKIIVEVSEQEVSVAASEFNELKHPSIKRKWKKSDEWLKNVNDLIRSILGSMEGRKFRILKAAPSNKSYTYYIRFQPVDDNGDIWDHVLEFQIELRDHVSRTHEDIGEVTKNLLVKTYYLDDKMYKDMYSLMKEIWRMLDDLQKGDFSAFFN